MERQASYVVNLRRRYKKNPNSIDLDEIVPVAKRCGIKLQKEDTFVHFVRDFDEWTFQIECQGKVNFCFFRAIERKNISLLKIAVKHGANKWNDGLCSAVFGGDWRLINFFIDKGANDWIAAMNCSALIGDLPLIKFFIDKGGDADLSLRHAFNLYFDNFEIVKNFIEFGVNIRESTFDWIIIDSSKRALLWLLETKKITLEDLTSVATRRNLKDLSLFLGAL